MGDHQASQPSTPAGEGGGEGHGNLCMVRDSSVCCTTITKCMVTESTGAGAGHVQGTIACAKAQQNASEHTRQAHGPDPYARCGATYCPVVLQLPHSCPMCAASVPVSPMGRRQQVTAGICWCHCCCYCCHEPCCRQQHCCCWVCCCCLL